MVEHSNKLLFMLLVIALVIAVLGTGFNVNRLNSLEGNNFLSITGAATDTGTGTSTLTISQTTAVSNNHSLIQFGSGYVYSNSTYCAMDSNGVYDGGRCSGFNTTNNFGFLIENTGNVNLSINYTCAGNCTAQQFINGTSPAFQIKTTANNIASQSGGYSAADTTASCVGADFSGLNFTTYKDISANGDWLCGNLTHFPLSFKELLDSFVIDLNVSIPENALIGARTATFTFNAVATG